MEIWEKHINSWWAKSFPEKPFLPNPMRRFFLTMLSYGFLQSFFRKNNCMPEFNLVIEIWRSWLCKVGWIIPIFCTCFCPVFRPCTSFCSGMFEGPWANNNLFQTFFVVGKTFSDLFSTRCDLFFRLHQPSLSSENNNRFLFLLNGKLYAYQDD